MLQPSCPALVQFKQNDVWPHEPYQLPDLIR
jgi:hypothetical protein